jgi:hypothetical protein
VLLLSAFLASTAAQATWSAAAVHAETGTIGVAAASCSYMVYGIAEVLPGQGVVIVQAVSSAEGSAEGEVECGSVALVDVGCVWPARGPGRLCQSFAGLV